MGASSNAHHPHGMESYLKSRANSVGPMEGGVSGEPGTEGEQAFDSIAMDSMLANGGFWDNVSGVADV